MQCMPICYTIVLHTDMSGLSSCIKIKNKSYIFPMPGLAKLSTRVRTNNSANINDLVYFASVKVTLAICCLDALKVAKVYCRIMNSTVQMLPTLSFY